MAREKKKKLPLSLWLLAAIILALIYAVGVRGDLSGFNPVEIFSVTTSKKLKADCPDNDPKCVANLSSKCNPDQFTPRCVNNTYIWCNTKGRLQRINCGGRFCDEADNGCSEIPCARDYEGCAAYSGCCNTNSQCRSQSYHILVSRNACQKAIFAG